MEEVKVKVESSKKAASGKSNNSMIFKVVGLVVLILAIAAAGFFYKKYKDLSDNPKQAVSQKNSAETERVLKGLKSIIVTDGENPTVARVEDTAKLKKSNADFYKNVKKGDYIIIYPKRAIIYRENPAKIINVAPIINTSDIKSNDTKATQNTNEAEQHQDVIGQ